MTYEQAVSQLEELALEGSDKLIPATSALSMVNKQTVWRMIKAGSLPVVRLAEYVTTREIAVHFFRIHIRPTQKSKEAVVLANRKQEIEDAIRQVMSSSRGKGR